MTTPLHSGVGAETQNHILNTRDTSVARVFAAQSSPSVCCSSDSTKDTLPTADPRLSRGADRSYCPPLTTLVTRDEPLRSEGTEKLKSFSSLQHGSDQAVLNCGG